ncbi:MAG TPA: hypothetical protein VNU25_03730 [Candidatus Paceibacterota bacterium]|nr:hypothetical protein [Candidatus Paceibacterota bacterium]
MQNPLALPFPELLLRAALAFSFVYPAIHALIDPYAWVGYIPGFVLGILPLGEVTVLHLWGAIEIALALWVLCGRRILIPALAMGLALLAVVLSNLSQFAILFRDLPIAAIAFALAWMHRAHA